MDCFASKTLTHGSALHWEDDACNILRASRSVEDIQLVCFYFPFQYPDTPLGILSSRSTESSSTDVDELVLRKAEETLRRIATECNSCSWNWQWSPPFASSTMGPTRAANDTDKDLLTMASKMTFMALERKACGFQSKAVDDILDGINHTQLLLKYRLKELVPKEEYEEVEKELKNPLARWIFSTSLRSTSGLPDASDALASILHPIKELFGNRELSLMSVLRRLKVLDVLHQDILDGLDPTWDGLRDEDFCFLEDVSNHTPRELAGLLIEKDLSCSQKFCPNDFLHPAELRSKSPQWSSLVYAVRVCAKAHPDLVWRIDEAAKILLHHRNFFSGIALVYGLDEANHPPAEPWWNRFTIQHICMAYEVRGWLLRLPQRMECDASSKPTGAETKNGRSCMGFLPKITSTLSATLFGIQQNMAGCPHTPDRLPEHEGELSRKQVDSMTEESWVNSSTMVGSEVGPKMEQGRNEVENVGSVASNLLLSVSESPGQHVNDPSAADNHGHTEIAIGPDSHDDSDQDSAIGVDRRDSTMTLSSEASEPVEKYGRGYHGYQEGKYLLPNDKQEQDRLDLQHELFCITLAGRLHLVRLPTTRRVLDIGTGTGIWSMDFADKYPDAVVYGVDLSPMQPKWTLPNCIFQVDDLSLSWNFDFMFDFIHGRMLFCSFSDPLHVFREAFKSLTAGGVLEMQDVIFDFRSFDDSLKGSALEEWAKKLQDAFGSKGIDLACVSKYRNYLETVGFENIEQTYFYWPVGIWPIKPNLKTLGRWCQANILDMLFAISIVPLTEHRQHSMSVEAVQFLLARVREDLHNPNIHAYLQVLVIHGRKPRSNQFLELEN